MSRKHHVAAAVAAVALAGSTIYGQNRPVPRTPRGTPDLQGVWSFATVTPLERPQSVTSEFLSPEEIQKIELVGSRHARRRPAQLPHRRAQDGPAAAAHA
jgi:hypothetical protein